MAPSAPIPDEAAVVVEVGARRVFASAVAWPGWCRSGRDEALALAALAGAAPRYAPVAQQAGYAFPGAPEDGFEVLERLPGTATTDFGAPGAIAEHDHRGETAEEAARLSALVAAAWQVFDAVAAHAPAALRKGPRGGGRGRGALVRHVLDAEASYARKLGIRNAPPAPDDRAAVDALRNALLEVLRRPADGAPPTERGWPPRYAARRIAWHVLDHAWEIEDRSV
jgi:hypothetical protein